MNEKQALRDEDISTTWMRDGRAAVSGLETDPDKTDPDGTDSDATDSDGTDSDATDPDSDTRDS